jgi:glycosyltransferase involved in cell wall biosynthesis
MPQLGKDNPLVSIIVRTKDRPKMLRRALGSIAAQGYRPIQTVIVNDGGCDLPVDEFVMLLSDIPVTYVKLKNNGGRARAANVGIHDALGDYFCFLDDDDIFYRDHVATLVSALAKNEYSVAYADANLSHVRLSDDGEVKIIISKKVFSSKAFSYFDLIVQNYIPLHCLLFSRQILNHVKGFDESFDIYEDWDFLVRAAEIFPFCHVERVTAEYVMWSNTSQVTQRRDFIENAKGMKHKILGKLKERITEDMLFELIQAIRVNETLKVENKELKKELKTLGYEFTDIVKLVNKFIRYKLDKYVMWRFQKNQHSSNVPVNDTHNRNVA